MSTHWLLGVADRKFAWHPLSTSARVHTRSETTSCSLHWHTCKCAIFPAEGVSCMSPPPNQQVKELDDYKSKLVVGMVKAWKWCKLRYTRPRRGKDPATDMLLTHVSELVIESMCIRRERRGGRPTSLQSHSTGHTGSSHSTTMGRATAGGQLNAIREVPNHVRRCPTEIASSSGLTPTEEKLNLLPMSPDP